VEGTIQYFLIGCFSSDEVVQILQYIDFPETGIYQGWPILAGAVMPSEGMPRAAYTLLGKRE
jgi:hypothetical protein